ncbi:hypothetical protein [Teredinibacter franksiae]|uniref:hypothetical protein n=1 Tax=Teredinibacter franksiae TaxID=2761453 RepID=UPI0016287ED5|nr:hypothetical protein [Teredinibacter franksiae]
MSKIAISDAVIALEDLLSALTNAYWETSDIHRKDCVFDLITTIFGELNELAKLSVSDHSMAYEPVTGAFHSSGPNLRRIQNNLDNWFSRSSTAKRLLQSIPPVSSLFEFV